MEKRMKNRLVMLGILAAAGLLAIGAGSAFGAEGIFNASEKDIKAVMNGSQVRIYEDDREIHNFTLPEGQNYTNYTWEISEDGDEINIHLAHDEEELEDSHGNEINETQEHEDDIGETQEHALNGSENELEGSHESGGSNGANESGLDAEHEASEDSLELSLQNNETQYSKAED